MSLKLVSVNIERSYHLPLVEEFLSHSDADAVCMQELIFEDIPRISRALGGAECIFEPMGIRPDEVPSITMGVGIFSRAPIHDSHARYYVGKKEEPLQESTNTNPATYNDFKRIVLAVDIEKEGAAYRIATTHFTWTPDGKPNDVQRRDLRALLTELEQMGEFVLTGDFNAPRGGEIFDALARKYRDNIPHEYTTSLDYAIHHVPQAKLEADARAAGVQGHMVDVLFTTPGYSTEGVRLVGGVSDHMAVVANIAAQH
ncbi:MAG: endonuclease/exonuclease/phosphatase [Parcubacteria group bacterium Athens0416_74]|nr:MAG: endonuclease/exonuclease/phosphatase [Parcubacteria group bacterium Athens0416_74]